MILVKFILSIRCHYFFMCFHTKPGIVPVTKKTNARHRPTMPVESFILRSCSGSGYRSSACRSSGCRSTGVEVVGVAAVVWK